MNMNELGNDHDEPLAVYDGTGSDDPLTYDCGGMTEAELAFLRELVPGFGDVDETKVINPDTQYQVKGGPLFKRPHNDLASTCHSDTIDEVKGGPLLKRPHNDLASTSHSDTKVEVKGGSFLKRLHKVVRNRSLVPDSSASGPHSGTKVNEGFAALMLA